jgi:hypothetical protein
MRYAVCRNSEFVIAAEASMGIAGRDQQGNYRGKLSANPYDLDSTANQFGRYGSPFSPDSLNNQYGAGSPYRYDSPNNPYGKGWKIEGR